MKLKRSLGVVLAVCLTACIVMLVVTACSSGPVGFWQIEEFTTGDVQMTEDDMEDLGLATIGSIKLQKSGNCVVNVMGDELEGTWKQSNDGSIEIVYDSGQSKMTGSIDADGVMTMTDSHGGEYKLTK